MIEEMIRDEKERKTETKEDRHRDRDQYTKNKIER